MRTPRSCIEFYAQASEDAEHRPIWLLSTTAGQSFGAREVGSRHTSPARTEWEAPNCAEKAGKFVWFVGVASLVYVSTPASTGAKLTLFGMIPRNRCISLPNSPFSA